MTLLKLVRLGLLSCGILGSLATYGSAEAAEISESKADLSGSLTKLPYSERVLPALQEILNASVKPEQIEIVRGGESNPYTYKVKAHKDYLLELFLPDEVKDPEKEKETRQKEQEIFDKIAKLSEAASKAGLGAQMHGASSKQLAILFDYFEEIRPTAEHFSNEKMFKKLIDGLKTFHTFSVDLPKARGFLGRIDYESGRLPSDTKLVPQELRGAIKLIETWKAPLQKSLEKTPVGTIHNNINYQNLVFDPVSKRFLLTSLGEARQGHVIEDLAALANYHGLDQKQIDFMVTHYFGKDDEFYKHLIYSLRAVHWSVLASWATNQVNRVYQEDPKTALLSPEEVTHLIKKTTPTSFQEYVTETIRSPELFREAKGFQNFVIPELGEFNRILPEATKSIDYLNK